MAYKEVTLNDGYKLSCTAEETGYDINNNTSTISVTGRIWRTSTLWAFSYTGAGKLEIYWHDTNQGTDNWLATLDVTEIGYSVSERTVSKSFSVAHKSDGKLSGWAWAVWTKLYNSGNIPPSGNAYTDEFSMTDIPRQANLVSAPDFNDEANPVITYSNPAGNAVGLLRAGIFNTGGTVAYAAYRDIPKTGSSYTFNLTTAERNALRAATPNSKTMKVRFYVRTEIGSNAYLSYLEKTLTITNANPTFPGFTFADTNSTTTGITGNNQVLISGKSTLTATISTSNKATANKSATMSKYTFQVAGISAEQAYSTSQIAKSLGSPTVGANELPSATRSLVVTAIDSRGNQTAVTKNITIVPYASPVVTATAKRANGFENNTTVSISGTFSRIEVGGAAKNTVNASTGIAYRCREQGTSTWSPDWTNRAATIDTAQGKVTTQSFVLNLDNSKSYEMQFRIIDKLETKTASLTVSVGQPPFWIGADGRIGVGGMPTHTKDSNNTGLLDVLGKIYGTKLIASDDLYTAQGWLKSTYSQLHNGGATSVPANANLNTATYCQVGRYACNSTATGQTIANNPSKGAFYMEVRDLLSNETSISGNWRYFKRILHNGTWQDTWVQYVQTNGSGTITWGKWYRLALIESQNGRTQTLIRLTDTLSAERTDTVTTNTGKSVTIYRKNNGSNNIIVASGISYVHRVLSVWSAGTNMPNNIGVAGLSSGSTIWSYYSGCRDGVDGAWHQSLTTDGQTDGFYYGTGISSSGNKYGVVIDYTAKRLLDQTWILLGNIQASGSGFALGFRMEVQAKDNNTIPTIYLRGTPPTNSTITDQMEFVE